MLWRRGLDPSGQGNGMMADSSELSSEPLLSVKRGEFRDQLLRKAYASWSWLVEDVPTQIYFYRLSLYIPLFYEPFAIIDRE
jgi:hypothetical protein